MGLSTIRQYWASVRKACGRVLVMSRRLDRRELVAVNAELRAELLRLRRELDRLRVENEVLNEAAAALIHQAPAHERFVFIHRLRSRFTVKRLCRILGDGSQQLLSVGQGPRASAGAR
jgi:hypothetical protein